MAGERSTILPAAALTVGNGDASGTFSGTIQNTAGQLALNKVGAGAEVLAGSVNVAGTVTVGGGALVQPGGNLQAAALVVDGGVFDLSGTAQLAAGRQYVGMAGTGSFTQSGGTNTVAGGLVLAQGASSTGTYNLNAGLLSVAGISAGSGNAAFNFGGGTLGTLGPWTSAMNINLSGSGGAATIDTTGGNVALSGNLAARGAWPRSAREL